MTELRRSQLCSPMASLLHTNHDNDFFRRGDRKRQTRTAITRHFPTNYKNCRFRDRLITEVAYPSADMVVLTRSLTKFNNHYPDLISWAPNKSWRIPLRLGVDVNASSELFIGQPGAKCFGQTDGERKKVIVYRVDWIRREVRAGQILVARLR